MVELYEYDGLLLFVGLTVNQQEQVKAILQAANLQLTLGATWMEVSYAGRDSGRRVIQVLCEVARIVKDAEGEIVCSFSDDEASDTKFEFYSIRNGMLCRQRGQIIRGEVQDVC